MDYKVRIWHFYSFNFLLPIANNKPKALLLSTYLFLKLLLASELIMTMLKKTMVVELILTILMIQVVLPQCSLHTEAARIYYIPVFLHVIPWQNQQKIFCISPTKLKTVIQKLQSYVLHSTNYRFWIEWFQQQLPI